MTRVFVLTTGRSGSLTFTHATAHATNYSAGHETKSARERALLDYPDQHIEADRFLAWLLGSLDRAYGGEPFYVHLLRDEEAVANSLTKRMSDNESWPRWLRAQASVSLRRRFRESFADTIAHQLCGPSRRLSPEGQHDAALAYVRVVNDNISMFLRDKTKKTVIQLEDPRRSFSELWSRIGAEGDLSAALAEFDVHYNASVQVAANT